MQLYAKYKIPQISDKWDTQEAASIKAKDWLYIYLFIMQLLSRSIVSPTHLETICSQKGVGSKRAMFLKA